MTLVANDPGVPKAGTFLHELARRVHPFRAMAEHLEHPGGVYFVARVAEGSGLQ